MSKIDLTRIKFENDEYISIRQIFKEIKDKTTYTTDPEIARFLSNSKIIEDCDIYNRYKLFDGKTQRLFGRNPDDPRTALDYKLLSIANGKLFIDDDSIWDSYVVYDSEFYDEFLKKTNINLVEVEIKMTEDNKTDSINEDELEVSELKHLIKQYEEKLAKAEQRIKELGAIQKCDESITPPTKQIESKLSTREENNIIKVLAVLSEMESKVDTSRPYEAHGILSNKAQLLGIESFPSADSLKKWFTKANDYKKS